MGVYQVVIIKEITSVTCRHDIPRDGPMRASIGTLTALVVFPTCISNLKL